MVITKDKRISNLLEEAIRSIPESNIRCTTDLLIVGRFLTDELVVQSKFSYSDVSNPVIFQQEMTHIRTWLTKIDPECTFFLCEDRFLWRVLSFVQAEIAVLNDVIPDFNTRFSTQAQSRLFFNALKFPNSDFEKYVKWHTACPMAYLLFESLPDKPPGFPGHFLIWTGPVKRFLKNILNRRTKANILKKEIPDISLRLCFGLLQGVKRGCAIVPPDFLFREVCKHVEAMSTPPDLVDYEEQYDVVTGRPLTDFTLQRGKLYWPPESLGIIPKKRLVKPIAQVFRDQVKSTIRRWNKSGSFELTAYEPSHNSCFEKTRQDGGSYMQIVQEMELPLIEQEIIAKGKIVINKSYQLPNMDSVSQKCKSDLIEREQLQDIVDTFKGMEGLDLSSFDGADRPRTSVIPLTEPLKVRVITKGEALPAYLAKSYQKYLKSYIDRFPAFVLTTRPLQSDDFRNVWKKETTIEDKFGIKLNFDLHVSGDYSAATDKLNINFTKLIFERHMAVSDIPEDIRKILRRVLYEQRLYYPKKYVKLLNELYPELNKGTPDEFCIDQANGQLMGSILSFPVLCLANLICYKCALEEYISSLNPSKPPIKVNIYDLPVLVNGDDIYFRTNSDMYQIWLKYITYAGFKLSVGKNYVHSSVFTINSQCFTYDAINNSLVEITYLNVGLLIGQSKSGVVGEKLPIWDLYNKVLKGSYNSLDTHKRFLYFHKRSIAQITRKGFYNLFLPRILGGLGFIRVSETIPVTLTRWQRQLGLYFHNQLTAIYQKPHIGEIDLSQAVLYDENTPIYQEPYRGERVIQSIKTHDIMPEGYKNPKDVVKEETLMIHTADSHFTPKLEFRSISSSTLRSFRASSEKKYRGSIDYFGFEQCVKGLYPYSIIQSDTYDMASYEKNLSEVIAKSEVENILEHLFEVTGPGLNPDL